MKPFDQMTEKEVRRYFRDLAVEIEDQLPPGPSGKGKSLFVLLVLDASQIAQYVSNADRPGIIKTLREAADRLEKREDVAR